MLILAISQFTSDPFNFLLFVLYFAISAFQWIVGHLFCLIFHPNILFLSKCKIRAGGSRLYLLYPDFVCTLKLVNIRDIQYENAPIIQLTFMSTSNDEHVGAEDFYDFYRKLL